MLDLAAAGVLGITVKNVYIFMGAGTLLVSFIGYEADIGTVQSMRTKQAIFAMYSVIPILCGVLGYIPMFFYNLDDKTRTLMYHELTERRNNIIKKSQEKAVTGAAADEKV